ncbi:Adhesin yadA precursor [Moraxella catarrhalis]|nr:Adhesin yadA precursor [Moraxella catarrhalis]
MIEQDEAHDRLIAANKADADAKFTGVQTDIVNNKITLAQHAKKIDDNQQAIEAKLGGKADLQKLSELKTSVDKNQAGIQLHDQKINNLGILHTMVARAVGANKTAIDQNKADIAKNNDSIEDLYEANAENVERLTQVDNNVFVNRLNIQELERKQENDIKDVVGMQNAIAEQADKNKNNIQDLAKAQLAGVEVMTELNNNVEKNKADADASFETLTKNQNTLIEKDKEHDKLITANKTAIDANKTAIDANKASADAKFAATEDAITKNGNAITANAKSITDLGTKVDGFDGRVTALDTKVNGFDGRISALDTKVNAFDGRITALDSKVENGMAAQAALSGLFQPYSVGKFNATAALGGYGSKSAVAIGAGYRVNPNLAFKAGAAINTSGDKKGSYNIGVNYEF